MAALMSPPYMDVGAGLTTADGAKLYFYVVGSATPKSTYTTAAATIAHANPVVSDAKGVFDAIYLSGDYDWILKDKNDVQRNSGSVSEFATVSDVDLAYVKQFSTLASALGDASLQGGDVLTTGDRGGATWNVVLSSTVTENTFDIVQCTGVGTLSLQLRNNSSPILEQFGVSTAATAAFNAGAIQRAIDVGLGGFRTYLTGVVDFNTAITQTGSGRIVMVVNDLKFNWTGITGATAWSLGDGVTSTQGNKFYNFKITDDAGGVDNLFLLNKANRNQFYSLVTTANNTPSQGLGIKLTESFINSFYGCGHFSHYNAIEFGHNTNGNNWYDCNIEGAQNDGIYVPTGINYNRNTFYGGVIEGVVGYGAHLTSPPKGLTFDGTYWEANGADIYCDHTAGATVPIVLKDNRSKSPTGGASIVVAAASAARILAERCNISGSAGETLFDVNNSSAWARAVDCISENGLTVFSGGSVGNLIDEFFNGANLRKSKLRSFELAGLRVPTMQKGSETSLAAGASRTVTFPIPFKNIPFVSAQLNAHSAVASVAVTAVSRGQVTFTNRAAAVSINWEWCALEIGDLNVLPTGTHTATASATVLTDSAAFWIVNEFIGKTVNNTADGSSGVILSNTLNTITVSALAGGTSNDWQTGEAYTVTAG